MAEELRTGFELRRLRVGATAAPARPGDIIDAYEIVRGPTAAAVTRYLHLPSQDSKHSRRQGVFHNDKMQDFF